MKTSRVFMSHSKEDNDGRAFFDKLFSSFQHEAYWYSWEGPTPPHTKTLLEAIRASSSMFVLLSKPMERKFTRSWVGYEVGLAVALNKNVWVFEPTHKPRDFIDVPVPYLTGYIEYPERLDTKNMFPFANVVRDAGVSIPQDPDPTSLPQFLSSFCAYQDCKAPFYRYVLQKHWRCPVCRRELVALEYSQKK